MTDKEAPATDTTKKAEVAPYMVQNKENTQAASNSSSMVVPAIFVLVLGIVVVASFFEDEYKAFIASFNDAPANPQNTAVTSTTPADEQATSQAVLAQSAKNMANAIAEETPAEQTAQIDRVYPSSTSSSAEIPPAQPGITPSPYGYRAPYAMPPRQAMAYQEAMQRRQAFITEMQKRREQAYKRMEQQHEARLTEIEKRREAAEKAHADWVKRMRQQYPKNSI